MQSLASPGNSCTFFRNRGQPGVCLCGDAHFRWVCAWFGVYAGFYGGLRGFPSALGYFTSGRVYRIRVAEGAICYSAASGLHCETFPEAGYCCREFCRASVARSSSFSGAFGSLLGYDCKPCFGFGMLR